MGNAVTKGDAHHGRGRHDDEETGRGGGGGRRGDIEILHNEETPLIAAHLKAAAWDDNGRNPHDDGRERYTHFPENHFFQHGDSNYCMVIINTKKNAAAKGGGAAQAKPKAATDDPVLRRLKIATGLCCTFMLVEVVGGYLAGSLAILSDAAHLTADLASFAVAIVAAHLAARPSTRHHTYGLKRTESLAALFSMTTLAVISVGLGLEALRRIYNLTWGHTEEIVDGKLMSGIATIGVLVNVALAAVLGEHHVHMPGHDHDHDGHDHGHAHDHFPHDDHDHGGDDHSHDDHSHDSHDHDHGDDHSHDHDHGDDHGHDHGDNHSHNGDHCDDRSHDHSHDNSHDHGDDRSHDRDRTQRQRNVNLHAAYLHVLADLTQSVAILLAGLLIWWKPQWQIVDPIATVLFCVLVFYSTLGVIRASVRVLLEEVPPGISWQEMYDAIEGVEGVCDVHDLHIWSISQGVHAMSVHLRLEYYPATATAAATATANTAAALDRKPSMDYNDCAKKANEILKTVAKIAKRNGIVHSTIQLQHTTADDGDGIQQSCVCCDLGGDESMAHNVQNQFR